MIPDETFDGEAKFLWQVASMMVQLQLHVSPRSQDDIDKRDSSQLWPTPPYYEWDHIQTVACRLFVTLEWARRSEAAAAEAALCKDEYTQLRETLVLLLTQLLFGHLQDDKLNMQEIFRFGLKPMLEEWTVAHEGSCALWLGGVFFSRLSKNIAALVSLENGVWYQRLEVIGSLWCTFGRSDMPLMQAKKNTMMGVLYAVPSYLTDRAWLMRQPCLNGFHEALTALPDSTARLTGLALFVRLCVVETPTNDFSPFLPPMTLQLYCIKAQSIGLFDLLYTTLTHVLKPPLALLKLAIHSLGERAEFITESHLRQPQMYLLQVAQLEFIVSMRRLYPQADQGFQAVLLRMLPQYQRMHNAAAGKEARSCEDIFDLPEQTRRLDNVGFLLLPPRTYDIFGLPDLRPDTFQSTLLGQVRMEDMHQHPELAEAAYASCMKWFVDTVTSAMQLPLHPAIRSSVLSPYFKLMRTVSGDMPSDPKLVLETCLASLRSFYLMIKKLANAHNRHQICQAEHRFCYKPDECCIYADMSVNQQQLVARRQELADEVVQLEACLGTTFGPICTAVHEVLPFFHKMSKHSSWASAMAAMEPDEWCWQNPRQYPVQELLDRLCQEHILEGSDARKAMIFFNWSSRIRQAERAAKAAEDKALKASQELLAEEQQRHAQAAAKQAKKQRQKAKKRQDKVNKQAQVPQDLSCHQQTPQAPQQEATQQQVPQQQMLQKQSTQLQLTPQQQSSPQQSRQPVSTLQQQSPQQQTPQQQSSQQQLKPQQQSPRQQSPQQPTQTPQPQTPLQLTPQLQSPDQPTPQQQEETQDDAAAKQNQASATLHRLLCCPITKVICCLLPVMNTSACLMSNQSCLTNLCMHGNVMANVGDAW
ncbi:hypothetical protein ABBQ38_009333 [Trebouxia sp. C0009 RCD-2024]